MNETKQDKVSMNRRKALASLGAIGAGIALHSALGPTDVYAAAGMKKFTVTTVAELRAATAPDEKTIYFVTDSGMEGHFYYDLNDTVSVDNVGTIVVSHQGARFKRIYEGPVHVRWFGAQGDGVNDDSAAIQRAIATVQADGGGRVYFAPGTYAIDSGIMITEHNTYLEGDAAVLLYRSSTGIAVDFNKPGTYLWKVGMRGIEVKKQTETWGTGAVGIRLKAVQQSRFDEFGVFNFDTGLYLHGTDRNGTVYNTILPRILFNNKINIDLQADNGGWCNENTFVGGQLGTYSGRPGGYADTINVRIGYHQSAPLNNNKFIGVSFEGNAATKAVVCEGVYNFFTQCRYEKSVKIELTRTSGNNAFLYGNNIRRSDITDAGARNSIYCREGIDINGGTIDGKGAARFSNSASAAYPSVEFLSPLKTTVASVDGQGNIDGRSMKAESGANGGFVFKGEAPRGIYMIAGSPEGVLEAAPGSLAINSSGGNGATLWVKELGFGKTGWAAK